MLGEGGLAEAMATIFVWLRYSSSRQLTWQRNYNTQPRILGEAQNRLTHAIARVNTLSLPNHARPSNRTRCRSPRPGPHCHCFYPLHMPGTGAVCASHCC